MTFRILLIDDDAVGTYARSEILRSHGYAVEAALDGLSGLGLLRSEIFDLVLLDFNMPGLDGEETAVLIRAEFPTIPIVMLSGHVLAPSIRVHLDGFLSKGESLKKMFLLVEHFEAEKSLRAPDRVRAASNSLGT
jgi:CheY-like chemotaxis protein